MPTSFTKIWFSADGPEGKGISICVPIVILIYDSKKWFLLFDRNGKDAEAAICYQLALMIEAGRGSI